MKIKKNSVLLFQGDSVTDCHRNRENDLELGNSFVPMIAVELEKYNIKVINRAISGNKVNDLLDRFDKDFKEVNPDHLVLLIGVNDTWHNYPNSKSDAVFEEEYDLLLSKIKSEMNCNVLIMEPFIIGYKEEYIVMRRDLLGKIEVIRRLCKNYGHEYISFDSDFAEVLVKEDEELYSIEGIHPKEAGYRLMANKILSKFEIVE